MSAPKPLRTTTLLQIRNANTSLAPYPAVPSPYSPPLAHQKAVRTTTHPPNLPNPPKSPFRQLTAARYRNQPKSLSPYRSTPFATVITVHSRRFCGMMAPRSLHPDSSPQAFSGWQHAGSSHSGFPSPQSQEAPVNPQAPTNSNGSAHSERSKGPFRFATDESASSQESVNRSPLSFCQFCARSASQLP